MITSETKTIYSERSVVTATEDVFVKCSDSIDLSPEAGELQRCRDLGIKTRNVQVVEIATFSEKENMLVTRRVNGGQSLFNLFWNSTTMGRSLILGQRKLRSLLLDRTEEIGVWLRRYHETESFLNRREEAATWVATDFRLKIESVRSFRLAPEAFLRAIEKRYLPIIETIADSEVLTRRGAGICWIHGDFHPHNFLMDEYQKVYILDFGETRIGTTFEDIGRFYELIYALSRCGLSRRDYFERINTAFLTGYGAPSSIVRDPLFQAVRAYNGIIQLNAGHTQKRLLSFFSNCIVSRITAASVRRLRHEIKRNALNE
jgi:hypothetical protein